MGVELPESVIVEKVKNGLFGSLNLAGCTTITVTDKVMDHSGKVEIWYLI
jgi:hypothetical protein